MSAGRLKKTKRKYKFGGKESKTVFLLIIGILAIVGFFLSKGSITQFFKVFAVEAAVFALIVFCILTVYKNKKGSRSAYGSKKHKNFHEMNDVRKIEDDSKYVNEKIKGGNINNVKTGEKNYNWVLDDESTQGSHRQKNNIETGRKLVYAGKIVSGEKKTMGDEDIKARVASWAKAVDFSDAVFKRIIEKTKESVKEENAGDTEDYSENAQGDGKNAEDSLQEEKICIDMEPMEEAEEIVDIYKVKSEEKGIKKLDEIREAEVLEQSYEEEENENTGELWFEEGIRATAEEERDELLKIEEIDGVVEGFGNASKTGRIEHTDQKDKTDKIEELQRPLQKNSVEVVLPTALLEEAKSINGTLNTGLEAQRKAQKLIDTLESFGVG